MTQATLIPLTNLDDGNGVFFWDISQRGPQAVNTLNAEATKALYLNLVKHVQRFPEEIDFCAIDLHGTMFDDKETYANYVAQTLDVALALSVLFVEEIHNREEESPEKQLIVIVNNWDELFKLKDAEQAHLYMELWTNLKAALQAGSQGIHLLMQISTPVPESPEQQRIVLNS